MRRLIIRPGAIGDCILSLPAMEHLRADYTEVWVARQNVPLVRFADRVRAIQATGLDLVGLPGLEPPAATLQALAGFDSIVSWYGEGRAEFRAAVAEYPFTFLKALPNAEERGAPFAYCDSAPHWPTSRDHERAVGALRQSAMPEGCQPAAGQRPDPRNPACFDRAASPHDSSGGAPMHAADWFLKQVGGLGTAVPRIECPRDGGDALDPNGMQRLSEPGFAVIHPFSGSARKNWPLERFRALAERLPVQVRWCAGPEEALENAVRFDDLYDLGCWLGKARLYIGNDSGITHLAAAVGTPTVALFGPTDPRVWAPRGPCVTVIRGAEGSMASIAVEEVLARLPL